MPKFFVDRTQIDENYVTVRGEDAHHISRSLRMAAGEEITVSDMKGTEYRCSLEVFGDGFVKARVIEAFESSAEPPIKIHLYQALPKGEKLDLIIQKSVECGAFEIIPFESERCVVKVKADAEARKTERRCKIAIEAAKQCGRGIIPTVRPTVSFDEMIEDAKRADLVLFCYEGEGTEEIGRVLRAKRLSGDISDIAIIIGSEGGFSPNEAKIAQLNGFTSVGLGKRILRAETAAIFATTCVIYEYELS